MTPSHGIWIPLRDFHFRRFARVPARIFFCTEGSSSLIERPSGVPSTRISMYSSSSLKAIVWVRRSSLVSVNPASASSVASSPGPPNSNGVGRYPVSSGSANSNIGATTALMAVAFSAVLQTTIPIRPLGRRTRWASLATVSGWGKIWKPNRHVARSNDSSRKSNFSASIARNVRPEIRRSFAMRVASSTICSERSMPTTRPSGPTMRAMLIAGSPRPVARSRADSRIFGFTRASRSNPYGSKSRTALRYDSALSFDARRMDSRSESSVDIAGGRGIPQGHHPFAISVSPRLDSEPLPAAEEHHHDDDNDPHQDERHDESAQVLLARERDVHSVCAGDESQRQDDRRDHGERLHDFVQAVAHDSEVDLHQASADLAQRVESVERLNHVIVHVAKVFPRLLSKAGEFAASEFRERVPLGPKVVPKD